MKKIQAVLFVCLLSLVCMITVLFFPFSEIRTVYVQYGGGIRGLLLTAADTKTLSDKLSDHIALHDRWIDLYGGVQRLTGVDCIGKGGDLQRMRDGRLTFSFSSEAPFSQQETDGLRTLKQAIDRVRARGVFILIPQKVCATQSQFSARGVVYRAEEQDALREQAFRGAGFETLDLHRKMHEEGLDHPSLFFRTDHHWTGQAGLWAAREIAAQLGLDADRLDASQFTVQKHPQVFLGSIGKSCGLLYSGGYEDFDVPVPAFATDFTMQIDEETPRSGSFSEALLFPEYLADHTQRDSSVYFVYLSGEHDRISIQNHRAPDDRRILLIKDSFSNCVAPYLALCCAQVDLIDPRYFDGSVSDWIGQNEPDIVCVTMTSFVDNDLFRFK